MKKWLLILFWSFSGGLFPQNDTLKILWAGDIMVHQPQLVGAWDAQRERYDFSNSFYFLKPYLKSYDWVIGNLETTIGVKPYQGYPRFSSPSALLDALKNAGFDVLVTANNHSADKGRKGIEKTIRYLQLHDLKTTGTFVNELDRQLRNPLLLEKKGFKIAVLNYTYGTNGLPVPLPTQVNLIDKEQIRKDVLKARALKPDEIIVFFHWGNQYQLQPSATQKDLEKFLHSLGIKIIIGSHPHVVQPVKFDEPSGRLTVFSLGNFISNQRTFPRDGSFLIETSLVKTERGLKLVSVKYLPVWVYKYHLGGKTFFEVLPLEDFVDEKGYFVNQSSYRKMMRFKKFLDGYKKKYSPGVEKVAPKLSNTGGLKTIPPFVRIAPLNLF